MANEAGYSWVLRSVRIAGREGVWDVGIADGGFREVAPTIGLRGVRETEGEGLLLLPPFVDSHFHLDSVLSLDETGENRSGTLLEGIGIWRRYKATLTPEGVLARADHYLRMAVARGLLHLRSHVDVSQPGLAGVHGLLELRRRWAGVVDIQLVAFPQDGFLRTPGNRERLLEALDLGVDVVGGIPHFERTTAAGDASVEDLCRIAAERNLPVDLHCDETDDPASRHVATLAACAVEHGLAGRVAASHTTSLHSVDNAFFAKLAPLLVEAGVSIVPNPLINLTLQGRFDGYPRRRGLTRIPELLAAGVNVSLGLDCVRDPWYPLGTGDLLEAASMAFHACPMTAASDPATLLAMVTTRGARTLGLTGYGIEPGNPANFVAVEVPDETELLRLRPPRRLVVREGRVLAETRAPETVFGDSLPGAL